MKAFVVMLLAVAAGVLTGGPALAYVGPGPGLSLLGALWGVLVAVVAAVSFVILWPMRRLLRRRREDPEATSYAENDGPAANRAPIRDSGSPRA